MRVLLVLLACVQEASLPGAGVGASYRDTAVPETALVFSEGTPSNVLVISLETARADWLSPRASGRTPRLDALLSGSLVLDDHRSCSNWTFASFLCVQAGARGVELGFIPSTASPEPAPDGITLVSEVLDQAGWATALVSSNTYFSPDDNLTQGFDRVDYVHARPAESVTDAGLAVLDGLLAGSKRWYLHLHYYDPHSPYSPPEGYRDGLEVLDSIPYDLDTTDGHNEMKRDYPSLDPALQALIQEHVAIRYAGELAYADAEIGRFLDAAAAAAALDDALLVFFTDHGEQQWEHGDIGHKYGLYEEENRSVAAFSAPGLVPGLWGGPTAHQDLWPTIFAALSIPAPPSFTGLPLGARDPAGPRFAIRHSGDPIFQFVEQGGVKLIYWWSGAKALYRLDLDPGEQTNLYSATDPDVQALWTLLLPEVDAVQAIHPEYAPLNPGP